MILSRIIGTVKNEDGTIKTKGKISQYSIFIGSSPAKNVNCTQSTKTPFEAYNNFLLENAPVNTFKQLKYQAGDTMNSTTAYDSYIRATTITSTSGSSYDSNTVVRWLHPENKTLYRTASSSPAPGEWPSPVFIETPRGNVIQVSEDSSFTKYYEYQVKTHVTDIYNLIPSKHYFYRILEGSTIIKSGEFDTQGQVRMIRLNALRNVRDCGGWPTVDGENRFKYGVIFRGGALGFFIDDSINTAANRALDLSTLENDFGVTGEVDLNGNLTIDPFYVGHNNTDNILSFSAACYYEMSSSYDQFYNVLNFILQKVADGGAVYVHCQQGRDRTGSFISVIQALCGVCDDGILKDYEITTFWGNGTYRYYLEHDDTQNASRDMWKEFASSGTTQERVQTWFRNNYVENSIGNKATAEEAIDYIKSLLLEPIEDSEYTFKVSYATNVSTDVKGGDETLVTVGSSATSGRTITTDKTEVNLVASTNASETLLGYSDLEGNLVTNPVDITQYSHIVPKVKGNLMYVKDTGYEWSDYLVSSINRYRLYKKANSSFCASAIIWTTANNPLKFTIASLANQTIKFRSINPVQAGGTFEASHNRDNIYKMVTLTLDSNGSATYTPLNTGMVVFNFAIKDVEGYTKFTTAQLNELQINYAKVSAWSIPSVKIDTILKIGGINQSIVYYNGYVIAFRDKIGAIFIIDVESKSIVRQVPVTAVTTSSVHCNAAAIMPIKYNQNDLFPMIMLSGDGSIARIIRLTGSSISSLTATKICDWHFTYYTSDWGGMAATQGPNLYYLKWSTMLHKINLDITNINNYVDRDIDVTSQATLVSQKIIKTGQDIEIVATNRGNLFISQYGPESDYWNAYIYSSDRYYLNGITISNLNDEGNIVGFVPFYRVRLNQGEPDGIAYAGNNVFYMAINTEGQATLYRLTIPFPEF